MEEKTTRRALRIRSSLTGVEFLVTVCRAGERSARWSGNSREFRHDYRAESDEVEFYDARYPHTDLGQFVTAYEVETILDRPPIGLDLYGGEPSWKIDSTSMGKVIEFLRNERRVEEIEVSL